MSDKQQTMTREEAEALWQLAYDEYEEWGNWLVETQDIKEVMASGDTVEEVIRDPKLYAEHARGIESTAW